MFHCIGSFNIKDNIRFVYIMLIISLYVTDGLADDTSYNTLQDIVSALELIHELNRNQPLIQEENLYSNDYDRKQRRQNNFLSQYFKDVKRGFGNRGLLYKR